MTSSCPEPAAPLTRILVADRLHGPALTRYLAERLPGRQVRGAPLQEVGEAELAWAEVLIGFQPPVDRSLASLRWVHSTGAGVDAFLFRRPWPPRVLLTRTTGAFGARIAEYSLSRALFDSQGMAALMRLQQQAEWQKIPPRELRGTRALVIGTGDIGRAVGRAFAALGSEVHGVSRGGEPCAPFMSVAAATLLADAVADADFIVVTVPLTEATYHLVGARVLGRCHGAFLINAARGKVVDHDALLAALEAGHLRGAALDVFDVEPLPRESPLWRHPRVLVSPHVAALTRLDEAGSSFLDNLADLEAGRPARTAVDPRRGY
ncbi:MAG: D-2-hydroxyacid dehydrogenase [Planctomycetota bacterium]